VERAAAKTVGVMPVVAEAMMTMSTVGGVSMMKTEVDQGWI
jgi:hypothetical protein